MKWLLIVVSILNFCYLVIGDDCYCAICELDQLPDNCTTIYGHIQMGLESTMPPFEIVEYKLENVTKVVGCITIANSGFTSLSLFSNLEVVQYSQSGNASSCSSYGNTITIAKNSLLRRLYFASLKKVIVGKIAEYGLYIVDNPSLCITEEELEQFLKTEKFYAPHIQICDAKKVYCRLDNFDFFDDTNIPSGCQVLTDSLILNGTLNQNAIEFQNRLNEIEQILGSIIVLDTEITSLKFPRLWRIYNFQPDLPIILLQNNPYLSEVDFSNLISVPYFGTWPDVLFAFQNPLLTRMSADTCGHLANLGEITFENSEKDACETDSTTTTTTTTTTPISQKSFTSSFSIQIGIVEFPTKTTTSTTPAAPTTRKTGNLTALSPAGDKNIPSNNDTTDNSTSENHFHYFISILFIWLSMHVFHF